MNSLLCKKILKNIHCRVDTKTTETFYPYSYAFRDSNYRLVNWTIGQTLDNAAKKYGNRIAYIFHQFKVRKSFVQMKNNAEKLAAGFLAIGLKPGNLIGIWCFNCYEWLITQFAAAKSGMILVQINPVYQTREMLVCLSKVQLHCLVATDSFKTSDYYKVLCDIIPSLPISEKGCIKNYEGTWKFQEVFHAGGPVQIRALQDLAFQIQADSPSNIMFTSGTTATPKAVVLSHFSLINNVALTGKRLMLWDESVILNVPASLTHTVGLCVASLGPIVCGYTSVFPSTLFTPAAVAESIQDEKCTALVGTPTMIVDLFFFSDFNKYDLSSLRFVVSGAAAIPVDVAIAVSTKINKPILTGYGSTESTCTVLLPKITDSLAKQSVKGLPLDLTEVKIVDTEGKIVPRGVNGELLVRGYCLMKEYWQESAKTRNVITKDGWYKTGDVAVMDELDYVQIVGRLHEMINRGGDNINPRDIEEFLSFHPNISAVQVFGVPDKRFGEVVCAWIIPKPNVTLTFEDIKNYCKGQIAHFKIPKYIVFVDEFPRTSTGKIQKYIMQEETLLKFSLRN